MTAHIEKREAERAKIRNILAAGEALHKRPTDPDLKLWFVEEFAAWLGNDDLEDTLADLRHEASGDCSECGRAHCICDNPYRLAPVERVSPNMVAV